MRLLLGLMTGVMLFGCAATPPVTLEGTDLTLLPAQAAESFELVRGNRIAWGGVIVAVQNFAEHTRIEVLAHPLHEQSARPKTRDPAQGRFLVRHEGYLETVDYAPGRELTVAGTLAEIETGRVGEADYVYPVVAAEELHLWKQGNTDQRGSFSFGFGIVITN